MVIMDHYEVLEWHDNATPKLIARKDSMPPRTRKKAAPKTPQELAQEEVPAVTAENAEVEVVETPAEENADVEAETTEDAPPVRRGGRKRSELAHAAREFEKYSTVTTLLEQRYAKLAERLSEVADDLSKSREKRDTAKQALDDALNGTAPDTGSAE
jgi:hypothetical protein